MCKNIFEGVVVLTGRYAVLYLLEMFKTVITEGYIGSVQDGLAARRIFK